MKNFKAAQPYSHTSFYGSALKTDRWWLKHELADSLKNITYKQLQSFINNVYLSQLFIESLMIGNLTAKGCYLMTKNFLLSILKLIVVC